VPKSPTPFPYAQCVTVRVERVIRALPRLQGADREPNLRRFPYVDILVFETVPRGGRVVEGAHTLSAPWARPAAHGWQVAPTMLRLSA
jgi:hypothetical protein